MTTLHTDNPVLSSARREMIVTFLIAALAMTWSVGYAYKYGYLSDPTQVELTGVEESLSGKISPPAVEVRDKATGKVLRTVHFIFGLPDWIVWAVVVPWGVCVGVSLAFGATFMRDEDLGEECPEEVIVEEGGRNV